MNFLINKAASVWLGLFVLVLVTVSSAQASDIEAELQNYIDIFQSDNFPQQRKVIDQLAWSGISDARLYDVIVTRLNEAKNESGKPAAERAAWYAKALSRSGNEKYRAVLEDTAANAESKKVRKHAAKVIPVLDQYIQWNPLIAAGVENAPAGRLAEFRVATLLNSSNVELLRMGAKRVYYAHTTDKELVGLAANRLEKDYSTASSDEQVDAMAWLIRVLAESGDSSYKPLLSKIAESAGNKKVRKYGKKYADYL